MRPNPTRVRGLILSALFATTVWWAAQPGGLGTAAASQGAVVFRTVQPGDTAWSIARSVQPEGDVRPLVDRILSSRGDRPLQVGEEIAVPTAR